MNKRRGVFVDGEWAGKGIGEGEGEGEGEGMGTWEREKGAIRSNHP